jgi:cysteine-rich repeat protein
LPAGDQDFWAVTVQEGWSIAASISIGTACQPGPDAPRLILYAPDGETELLGAFVDTQCPRIDPAVARAAADLDAGTYFIAVAPEGSNASISEYQIDIEIIAPVCPNGIRDGSETCDDGNLIPGDGCNAACAVEPEDVFSLPAAERIGSGAITPAGDEDVFQIDVAPGAGLLLSVQTYLPDRASGCLTGAGDTVLELFDADFDLVADNDDLPPTLCSMLENVVLAGGATYFLVVRAYAQNETIAAYEVVVSSQPVDVCGNGLTESSNNEQCDDGNADTGDGCNPACNFELAATFGPPGGSITHDLNGFTTVRLNATQPGQSIRATVSSAAGCPAGLRLSLLDAGFAELGAAGNPPFPTDPCTVRFPLDRFAFDLAAGTYHLRIEGNGTIDIDADIVDAACGDGNINARIGDACDDRNVLPGDGCDEVCLLEGNVSSESEVNDNQSSADATLLAGVGSVVVAGNVSASGDDDVFSFTVPPNTTLSFGARTHSLLNDETSCDNTVTDTRIFLEAAGVEAFVPNSGELAYSDDVSVANPAVWCSRIANVPLSGGASGATFYVRVQGYNDAITPTYFMTLTLQ